ncbi:MAG: hypothetical protein ACOYBO_00965 [Azonexus sp.]
MTIGGFVGRITRVGTGALVGARVTIFATVALIFVMVAAIVLVAFSVGVNVLVAVAVGSNVNVAGIGVKVSATVAVGTSMMTSTFFGASFVHVGTGAAAGAPQAASNTTMIANCKARFM